MGVDLKKHLFALGLSPGWGALPEFLPEGSEPAGREGKGAPVSQGERGDAGRDGGE